VNPKVWKRGMSELVTILVLVAVAVVAAFSLRSWLSAQLAKTPATEMAIAEWSAVYTGSVWIITINVRNNLDRSLTLNATRIAFADGSVQGAGSFAGTSFTGLTLRSPTSLPQTIAPKSSLSIVVTSNAAVTNPPKVCEVAVIDTATRASGWVQAVGGQQV